MNDINFFFDKLKFNSGAIWLEQETIKVFVPAIMQNQETKDFIINNKSRLITVLKDNGILSKEMFSDLIIFTNRSVTHYPLSPVQERLWHIEQHGEGSNSQHLPLVYELDSNTDIEAIKYALQQIVSRHEILRTTIQKKEAADYLVQVVHEEPLSFEYITLTETDDFDSIIKREIHRPFKLAIEYPVRIKFYLVPSAGNSVKTLVLVNLHFIAHDGWSFDIFQRELYLLCEAYSNGNTTFCLPPLDIQYKDYALWLKSYLAGDAMGKQVKYWRDKLVGHQTLNITTDYPRPEEIDYKGATHIFTINKETSEQLQALAQLNNATLNSVMLSSVNILLSKCTGQDDIVIGRVMANRLHRQTEGLIGAFANRLACRTTLKKSQSFNELIQQVHLDQVEAQLYQDVPIEKLVEALQVAPDRSKHPVFQVMFSVQNFGNGAKQAGRQQVFYKHYDTRNLYEIEKFDLSIFIDDYEDELEVEFGYFTSLFHKDTISKLADQYQELLDQLIQSPDKAYSHLRLYVPEHSPAG